MSENQSRLLADRIYEQLKADIISCKYQPGDSLTESEMANKFNVSCVFRTIVITDSDLT